MNSALKRFKAHFRLDWTALQVGWEGPAKHPRLIDVSEVRDFALAQLGPNSEPEDAIIELATVEDDSTTTVGECLRSLSASCECEIATRKWIACLLEEVLSNLGDDPLYGLLKITEFWEKLDYPETSPHVVQGRDESSAPSDYYTDASFRNAVERHRIWLTREIADLQKTEALADSR